MKLLCFFLAFKFLRSVPSTNKPLQSISGTKIEVKKWVLVNRPDGLFSANRDAKLVKENIDLDLIDFTCTEKEKDLYPDTIPKNEQGGWSLEPDDLVIAVEALSVDAAIRTMLDENAFFGGIKPGSTIPAQGYGKVIKAGPKNKFREGAQVKGLLEAATITVKKSQGLTRNTLAFLPNVKLSTSLGCLGISGITAYIGTIVVPTKKPQKGETVVISAAAGGCGNIAAQIAKLRGARVVGIAGGPLKKKFLLEEMGLDGVVDYKDKSRTLQEQMKEACPNGIDFFFDNVGGSTLDAVLEQINSGSRIVVCGAVSQYARGCVNKGNVHGPTNYLKLAERSSTLTGFNMADYEKYFMEAKSYLLCHYYRNNIKLYEHWEEGIERFPMALEMLFTGGHIGRLLVDVDGKQQ